MTIPWKPLRSIFFFLLFLEFFFWVGGFFTQTGQFLENKFESSEKNVYRIMCVGESMTMVGGKDSYPSQLEDILNQNSGGARRFQVINQGIGGATTAMILQRLPQWLQMYKPDMVIAMTGGLDPLGDKKDIKNDRVPDFIKKIKLYRLFCFLQGKLTDSIAGYLSQQKKGGEVKKEQVIEDSIDFFHDELDKQSKDQKILYTLIVLAEGDKRDDIAELLYERFLQNNHNSMVNLWMIQKYGRLLIRRKEYEKFVSKMDEIPYDSWPLDWVRGYCHGEDHMERVRQIIEKLVTERHIDPVVYNDVASCYEEGNRSDLASAYYKQSGQKSSYYYPDTRQNYIRIKENILSRGMQPVFVQYPLRNISPLLSIFSKDPDKEGIIFVDNEPQFREGLRKNPYEYYFKDRMFGDIGHETREGNSLLASNIAKVILNKLFKKNLLGI